jgi:CheY-like chemotaxis protein
MKIMYVEDNPANLSLLQRIARMGGHEIVSYTDGESALTHYDVDKPDLILMDVQLSGGMTGLDVVKMLRAKGYRTPIVAVTAYAMTGDRERCLEAGCDTYIAKPLPVAELVELVQRYEARLKSPPVIQPLPSAAGVATTAVLANAPPPASAHEAASASPAAPLVSTAPAPTPVTTPLTDPIMPEGVKTETTEIKAAVSDETQPERALPVIQPLTPPDKPVSH